MLSGQHSQADLLEQVVELARKEADILVRLTRWRPPGQERREPPFDPALVTPQRLVRWAQEIAEALIGLNGLRDGGAGTASRLWSRIRAMLMMYRPDWTADEFVIYQLTRDQHAGFPFGLAASDLIRLADGQFGRSKIRSAMRRLARKGLIRECYSKRIIRRLRGPLPTRESVWFYSGPSSKYAEKPEGVLYMHTPWDDRPAETAGMAASG